MERVVRRFPDIVHALLVAGASCAIAVAPLPAALAQAAREAAPSPAVRKEFTEYITRFRAALKANDSASIAGMVKLPLPYDSAVQDASQFRTKAYPRDFAARYRACIQRAKAVHARDGLKNDTYSIFCGDTIFTFTRTSGGFLFTDIGMND